MIAKVLIAEDHEGENISVQKTMEDLGISNIDYVFYCDDALAKIEHAIKINFPYDLLITDLYFEEDHRAQKIAGGAALIIAARQLQADLKVLVFSAENKAAIIESLYNKQAIDGYVRKARNDVRELKSAISLLAQNQHYFPRPISQLLNQKNAHEFTEFDIAIITLLAEGVPQKNIPSHLKEKQIQPSGLSSVEKRLNRIKDVLGFSKNEQLIAFCKDMGII